MSIYCEDCVLPNDGEDLRESIQHTDLGAFAALKKKKTIRTHDAKEPYQPYVRVKVGTHA